LDDLIVWMPSAAKEEPTGKRMGTADVISYKLDSDAQVLVEVQIPMTVAQLQKLKEWSRRASGSRGTTTALKGKPVSVGSAASAAFAVGYAIGEKLDDELGLSDTISDWAADNIPWPF
jgi:hypothetical protein